MRLLWISTKPPWPPADGGRLAQALTLEALAGEGVAVRVVAPAPVAAEERPVPPGPPVPGVTLDLVPVRPRPFAATLMRALIGRRPFTVARHALPAVARRVAEIIAEGWPEAVHVEQLQAWPQSVPAAGRMRRVLRAQNVESDLWRAVGEWRGFAGLPARWEVGRLARFEGRAVAAAEAAVALTERDGQRLSRLAGGSPVAVVPPPFPAVLPIAAEPLPGRPAVVVLGSGGWLPNRDAQERLEAEVWPAVARRLPGAMLHLFGGSGSFVGSGGGVGGERLVRHPAPDDIRRAFAPGSVLLVPLAIASGIRMKILEAWARGVPVVATPEAAAGLRFAPGRELLIATSAEDFAAAVERLAASPELAGGMIEAGRRVLRDVHEPAAIARRLLALYHR